MTNLPLQIIPPNIQSYLNLPPSNTHLCRFKSDFNKVFMTAAHISPCHSIYLCQFTSPFCRKAIPNQTYAINEKGKDLLFSVICPPRRNMAMNFPIFNTVIKHFADTIVACFSLENSSRIKVNFIQQDVKLLS